MAATVFRLTDVGRAALVNAGKNGVPARVVASIGLTPTNFVFSASMTALPGEVKRVATISGGAVGDDTIHVTIRDETTDVYTLRGLGLYLDDGTLAGVYSQAAVIAEKSAGALLLLSTDLRFIDAGVSAGSIVFGDATFTNPPATGDRAGVVKLASSAPAAHAADAAPGASPDAARADHVHPLPAKLATARKIAGVEFDGSANIDIPFSGLATRPTTLAGYGITDAAPASHVGAGGGVHAVATSAAAGFMSAGDKAKLDSIAAGAQPNAVTSVAGRTGAVTLGKADVGLGNVDNTPDAQKAVASASYASTAANAGNADTLDGMHAEAFALLSSFSASLADTGGQSFPSGLLLRWGTFTSSEDVNQAVVFPLAFVTKCLGVIPIGSYSGGSANSSFMWSAQDVTKTGFIANRDDGVNGTYSFRYLAFGF